MNLDDLRTVLKIKASILSHAIGEVTNYDAQKNVADIRLYAKKTPLQDEGALLREVPILRGFGGKSFCVSPLKEKDMVVIGFSSHDFEEMQKRNTIHALEDSHNHKDAFVIGTIYPFGDSTDFPKEEGVFLGFSKSFFHAQEDSLTLKVGEYDLTFSNNGSIKFGAIEISQEDIKVGNISIKNHMHSQGTYTTPVGGGAVTGTSGTPL